MTMSRVWPPTGQRSRPKGVCALQHPEQGAETTPLTQYTQSGALNAAGQTPSSALNLLV